MRIRVIKQKSLQSGKIGSCRIEGKRVFLFEDDAEAINVPLIISTIFSLDANRVYHLVYEIDSGNWEKIATYKFPLTAGVGAIHENMNIGIVEMQDKVIFYYDRKPTEGINFKHNPFSKEIQFEYNNTTDFRKVDGACYYYN